MTKTNAAMRTLPLRARDRDRLTRGEVVFRAPPGSLFAESPKPTDALQGVIGDCYYLSALSALARARPELLREAFRDNGDGTFTARFFRRAEDGSRVAEAVTVDGSVPLRATDGHPIYARARELSGGAKELWPLVAEKAYAAWKGGYHVMGEGGLVEETLEELTGERTRMLLVGETHPEELWSLLERATRERWPTVVCTQGRHERPGIDELGFHPNHIVIFLGVHKWMGRRIVWLRDPFDVPACGTLVRPDPFGVYTIGYDEFLAYFAEVEINSPNALGVPLAPHPSVPIGESLERSYVFGFLPAKERRSLAKAFRRHVSKAGETIAHAGAHPERLHVLEHGRAAVELSPKRGGKSKRITVTKAGESFGDLHVLEGRKFDASLVALTDVAHYSISREELARWIAEHPEIEHRLRRRWDLRVTMLDWSARQLTTLDADMLLSASRPLELARGGVVFERGDLARFVYLVIEGQIEVRDPGKKGKRRALLGAGEVFGEVEVLSRRPRIMAARATKKTSLLEIDLGESADLVERFDVVSRQLAAIAERHERMRLRVARHQEHAASPPR